MGIEVMGKWEWECPVGLRMGRYGNGKDLMGVGREWEQDSQLRTPLLQDGYVMTKSGRLELGDNINGHYRSIVNHCYVISRQSNRKR